jgi:hypothetical protein
VGGIGFERLQQRAAEQELAAEQLARLGTGLRRPDREQLAPVVPVVDGVVEVDALVALQPDQLGAGGGRERPCDLGLADPRLALEQQRLLERRGEEDGGGEAPVREIALPRQGLRDGCCAVQAQTLTASSTALRVSTRARWRL